MTDADVVRYLSLFLGRPAIVRTKDCDVQLPFRFSGNLAPDGSTNTALVFLYHFITMSQIVGEAKEKVNPLITLDWLLDIDGSSLVLECAAGS